MINLKLLLLLALVSFSAQDACLQKFQICSKDIPVQTKKIDNCIDYYTDGGCYQCKLGYAVSSDQKSCKSFANCLQLQEGDKECAECYIGYEFNDNKVCVKKNLLPHCWEGDSNECKECAEYAVLNKQKKCELPKWITGCEEYNDDGTCHECGHGYIQKGNTCVFKDCTSGDTVKTYCGICELGYYTDFESGECVSYDGSKVSSSLSNSKKVELSLLIFILALLI